MTSFIFYDDKMVQSAEELVEKTQPERTVEGGTPCVKRHPGYQIKGFDAGCYIVLTLSF